LKTEEEVSMLGKGKKRHFPKYGGNEVCERRNQVRKAKKKKFKLEGETVLIYLLETFTYEE